MSFKWPHSCGALFYTVAPNGEIGIILGDESRKGPHEWLPFKGCAEVGESFEQAARREIKEESGGLVVLDNINLEHHFSTKRKTYHIGLVQVPYDIIANYNTKRCNETRYEYMEKRELRFFPLKTILQEPNVHPISRASIIYYWHRLQWFASTGINISSATNKLLRDHAVPSTLAKDIKDNTNYDIVKEVSTASLKEVNDNSPKEVSVDGIKEVSTNFKEVNVDSSKEPETNLRTKVLTSLKEPVKKLLQEPVLTVDYLAYISAKKNKLEKCHRTKIQSRPIHKMNNKSTKPRKYVLRESKSEISNSWRKA